MKVPGMAERGLQLSHGMEMSQPVPLAGRPGATQDILARDGRIRRTAERGIAEYRTAPETDPAGRWWLMRRILEMELADAFRDLW